MNLVIIETSELQQLIEAAVLNAISKTPVIEPKKDNDQLLTVKEVANTLQVSISTVNNHKKQGLIPFHRIGTKILFKKSEIINCLIKSTII